MTTGMVPSSDRGGIVVGWLIKIVAVLFAFGIVAYDGVSIALTRVTASDEAHSIAEATADALNVQRLSTEQAMAAGLERAHDRGVTLRKGDLVIARDGTVTVHVHRTANTLVTYRIAPLRQYTEVDAVYSTLPGVP